MHYSSVEFILFIRALIYGITGARDATYGFNLGAMQPTMFSYYTVHFTLLPLLGKSVLDPFEPSIRSSRP